MSFCLLLWNIESYAHGQMTLMIFSYKWRLSHSCTRHWVLLWSIIQAWSKLNLYIRMVLSSVNKPTRKIQISNVYYSLLMAGKRSFVVQWAIMVQVGFQLPAFLTLISIQSCHIPCWETSDFGRRGVDKKCH